MWEFFIIAKIKVVIKDIAKENYKQAVFVILIVIVALWLSKETLNNEMIQEIISTYGYYGIFAISAISGFNLVVPIPVVTFLPAFLASGLEYWYVIFTIALGMTTGDTFGYLVGKAGKTVMTRHMKGMMKNLTKWQKKNPRAPLLFLAVYSVFAPLPNEVVVVPLAFLGYELKKIFPIILTGNFIFNVLVSKGIIHIFNII